MPASTGGVIMPPVPPRSFPSGTFGSTVGLCFPLAFVNSVIGLASSCWALLIHSDVIQNLIGASKIKAGLSRLFKTFIDSIQSPHKFHYFSL